MVESKGKQQLKFQAEVKFTRKYLDSDVLLVVLICSMFLTP